MRRVQRDGERGAANAGIAGNRGSNAGNYTFGGFGAGSWSKEACCADPRNDCSDIRWCIDQSASDDFLFGLWMPGRAGGEGPERYLPTGAGTDYQYAGPGYWPVWGGSSNGFNIDLKLGSRLYGMGYNGPPGSKCLVLSGPHLRRLAQRDLRR